MHKNNLSFDTLNPKTPLSARWAQMSKQEQIIETKRLEILAKMEAQKKSKQKPAETKLDMSAMNKFSNDGSFLNQFKKLSDDLKQGKKPERDTKQTPTPEGEKKHPSERSGESRGDRHQGYRNRDRSPNREQRRNVYKWEAKDRRDESRDRSRRWDSSHQGFSSSNPVMESPRHPPYPPPRYYDPAPVAPNIPPPMFPNSGCPPFPPSPLFNPNAGPNFAPPGNNFHPMQHNFGNRPPFQNPTVPPRGPPGHYNPDNRLRPPPVFGPSNPLRPGFPLMDVSGNSDNLNRPPFPLRGFDENGSNTQPPNLCPFPPMFPNLPMSQQGPPSSAQPNVNFRMVPPMSVPLHTIPEPKPLNTLSIPPPKPLDAVTIPPPRPLEPVSIPPPKPMNLQAIPPPSPICLTQIPKPKELDVCSIPPPPISTVLSAGEQRRSTMEQVAIQVARTGDDLEDMLKTHRDPSVWFLRDDQSDDYRTYREMVSKHRKEMFNLHDLCVKNEEKYEPEDFDGNEQNYIPEEEKYEPEFSLDYESSEDDSKRFKKEIKTELKTEGDRDNMKFGTLDSTKSDTKVKMGSGTDSDNEEESKKERRERKRKSRWGDGPSVVGAPGVASVASLGGIVTIPVPQPLLTGEGESTQLCKITRQEPGLLQYALNNYGSANLSEEDWKKCEDHYKISLLYQEMLKKRREVELLAASGRHKYEYDSDEEVEGGTWEHRLRLQEMEATSRWAGELTRAASGKHHIGDFLPPDELKRFMDKYSAVKGGQEPDLSDYKEYKLKEDNIGFKMLQKLGWSEGEGLGADGSGIVNPVNKGSNRESNQGLGVERGDDLEEGDDEFDAYRKRMMLAYRFRPNPLNNPRRPYY